MNRDHGGNLDQARQIWGGDDWIDLSTGINRQPWPVPALPDCAWTMLPTASAKAGLMQAAAQAFATDAPGLALPGAQAAIQLVPRLAPPGLARILSPTYNEHAAALRSEGWTVQEVDQTSALAGADLAIVVNPNNPDGRRHSPADLVALSQQVGRLIIDESFADPCPELSVADQASDRLIVLRSFGKFWGLAGLRLGFVFAGPATIDRLQAMAGPWPVSGLAIEVGGLALRDQPWRAATIARLRAEIPQIDAAAARAGWSLIGGCELFRLYDTPDATAARDRLARHRIWSRIFPWSPRLIRLGLPGTPEEWQRLEGALT